MTTRLFSFTATDEMEKTSLANRICATFFWTAVDNPEHRFINCYGAELAIWQAVSIVLHAMDVDGSQDRNLESDWPTGYPPPGPLPTSDKDCIDIESADCSVDNVTWVRNDGVGHQIPLVLEPSDDNFLAPRHFYVGLAVPPIRYAESRPLGFIGPETHYHGPNMRGVLPGHPQKPGRNHTLLPRPRSHYL